MSIPADKGSKFFAVRRLFAAAISLIVLCHGAVIQVQADESAPVGQAGEDIFNQLPELDSEYQQLLDLYQGVASHSESVIADSSRLVEAVKRAPNDFSGSGLIRKNLSGLMEETFDANFEFLLAYLYKVNDTATVKVITDHINKASNPAAASINYFLLAQYYYQRNNWNGVRAALSKVNINDLSLGDRHYHDLLMGYALQALKEHRSAVKYYKHIPASSPYYPYAKLNQGTAFLRQGWWSEAHEELKAAIENLDGSDNGDFRDRLLVALAYSQLNYEFYRDARTTLRRVSLDGAYTNKAIMGLGLAAAYQEDFAGAVNAFKLLVQKEPADLSVDEAHLLLAYAMVEMGDKPGADIAYSNAVNHFQSKIDYSERVLQNLTQSTTGSGTLLIEQLNERADELYGDQALVPAYFLENYQSIKKMQQQPLSPALQKDAQNLRKKYEQQLNKMVSANIQSRTSMLESYLSQAKYGKAKLYDK